MTIRQGVTPVPPTTDPMLLRDVLAECDAILALTNHLPPKKASTDMGHHVTITSAQFHIHPDLLEQACQAMKELNKSDKGKSGINFGLLPDGTRGITGRVFAWMPADYDEKMSTAREILEAVGFTVETPPDNGIVITEFDGPTGDEDVFLDAVAPYVTAGSYLKWRSEDALLWEDRFDGYQRRTFTGHAEYVS